MTDQAARSGNTNEQLKLNRLRLQRAQAYVNLYSHLTMGGRRYDNLGTEIQIRIEKLSKEIEANE